MAILDVAVANIALPLVGATLHASGPQLQMVTVAYIAAYALLLIICARLGKMLGYRRVFMAGLGIFTLASLACGLSPSPELLIAARLVQGAGAALMMPQVLSLIQQLFEGTARARALSWYATVIAGGAIVGQIAGGLIVSGDLFGLSWRPVFLINVPIGLVLYALSWKFLPRDGQLHMQWRRLDMLGALLLTGVLAGVLAPIMLGAAWAWTLAIVAVCLGGLVRHELMLARRDSAPLLPALLFRQRRFLAGTAAILLAMAGYGGMLFLLTIFIQDGLGKSALVAGLAFLPSAVAFGIASLTWRHLPARLHHSLPSIGLAIAGVALYGLGLAAHSSRLSVGMEVAVGGFGLGMGLAFSPLFAQVMKQVPTANASDASGILTTANQLGQTLGVAAYGAVLFMAIGSGAGQAAAITAAVMGTVSLLAALLAKYAVS